MTRSVESPTKEILEVLGGKIDDLVRLDEVFYEFPEGNRRLKYPSMSILSGSPTFTNQQRYIYDTGTVASNQAEVKYVIGQFELNLQLDLWCRTKEERHDKTQELIEALNSEDRTNGLSLVLEKYHGVIARYDFVGYSFDDEESESQRKEWRATLRVLAHCDAITARKQYIIDETEVTVELPDEIPSG